MITKIDINKIWKFLKSKIFTILLIVVLIGYAGFQYNTIQNIKRDKAIKEQNIIALNDSLKYERTKNGELIVSIAGYISTEKELKSINKDLWERVKGQSGDIISLNHVIIQLRQDSIQLQKWLKEKDKIIGELTTIDSNTYAAPWVLPYVYDSTNFDIISGRTYIKVLSKNPLKLIHSNTEIIERLTQIDLTWGQKVEDKQLRVFVQSAYPGFTVAAMEGVLIDPNSNPLIKKLIKEKHWFTGLGIGVGISAGFNITSGTYGLVIGPSFIYNIYKW